MYRKILVTGGSAVAGSALKAIHQSEYPDHDFTFIGSKECNLLDQEATIQFVKDLRPDAIIHWAAISGGIGLSMKHPASMLRDNVMLNFNVLEAARLCRVQKTIMTLTTGMYPNDAPIPLKEDFIHDGPPHESNYGSSFAKRLVEPAIRAYREEYGMNVIGLVPNGIFGENDNFNENDAPMVPTLIRRFHTDRETVEPIVIWGEGTPLREYTYAKDVARAFMWCLLNYDHHQIMHTGTIEELAVKEIALQIAEFMGVDKARIRFDTAKPKGIFRKNTDNSRFVALSGFRYTSFKEGLRNTVRWFRETSATSPEKIRTQAKGKMRAQQ